MDTNELLNLRVELFTRQCTTLSGAVLLLYDMLGCSKKEYKYIFHVCLIPLASSGGSKQDVVDLTVNRTPITWIKGLYIVSRYFALGFQTASLVMVMGPLTRQVPQHICERWSYLNLVNIVFLLALVEVIIMLRVYALYQKNLFIGVVLVCFALAELSMIVACALPSIPNRKYGTGCITLESPTSIGQAGLVIIITQVITCGLAAWRCKFNLPEGWSDAPIVLLVIRDGAIFHVGICAFLIILIPITIHVKDVAYITLGFVSCLSIVACRLIINMQELRLPELSTGPESASVFELTTFDLSTPPRGSLRSLSAVGSSIP